MSEPINFMTDKFLSLSPFSTHSIEIWGETFSTVEHAYQSTRIKLCPEREAIKSSSSPLQAWELAQKYKNDPKFQNPDFNKDAVMEELFRAKLEQHQDVKDLLLETGDSDLLKVNDTDFYWGTGKDGSGQNKMGKLWMKLRSELNSQA